MVRCAVVLTALALLAACALPDPWAEIPAIDYPSDDVEGVVEWVEWWLVYLRDEYLYGEPEHWASPAESYATQAGDCEDHVILALYLLDRDFGISGRLVLGQSLYAGAPTDSLHAWLRVGSMDYDVVEGAALPVEYYRDVYSLSWPEVRSLLSSHRQ